jgi:dephospho-CoA kinase
MALAQRVGNDYNNIRIEGGRTILGNVYGQSPDERALEAILDSLRYDGMTDRRDTLAEAQEGTFDWTFLEGETKFLTWRWIDNEGVSHDYF